jgi:tRNA dimethylallyltransferase
MRERPAVLAIVGPTASGKSSLALDIARGRTAGGLPTELVAVDAFTVYRRLDVGTAKPSPEDRAAAAHHALDLREPWEEVSVADFQREARSAIDGILARGATPLLVGGSGLYFRAVVDDLRFPPTDPEVRARLEARWWERPAEAHTHLTERDPRAAANIDPANVRRTVRALEVIELTGEPFSSYDDAWSRYRSIYPGLEVGYLEPDDEVLRAAIRRRVERMVDDGLLDETRTLLDDPRGLSRTAARAIGYAEAAAVLAGELDPAHLVERIATRTWRYAKRQRSWFRGDPRCVPTPPDALRERWLPGGHAGTEPRPPGPPGS